MSFCVFTDAVVIAVTEIGCCCCCCMDVLVVTSTVGGGGIVESNGDVLLEEERERALDTLEREIHSLRLFISVGSVKLS